MPTLRPITSRAEILAYHQFRYDVYVNSDQRGFLAGQEGCDMDEFDSNALHLGWFEGDRLVGCVRLLSPIKARDPLHLFKDLTDPGQRQTALEILETSRRVGKPVCEVSRLCLAPGYRSVAHVKEFVLSIIATAHRYGLDHCAFTCDQPHAAFWLRTGFTIVPGFAGYARARSTRPGYLLQGRYAELLKKNRAELQHIGWMSVAIAA